MGAYDRFESLHIPACRYRAACLTNAHLVRVHSNSRNSENGDTRFF